MTSENHTRTEAFERETVQRTTDIEVRMSRLETVVEGLAKDVSSLAQSVNSYVASSGKTNWSVIFTGISIVAASVLWIISSQIAPLRESQSRDSMILDDLKETVERISSSRFTLEQGENLEIRFNNHQLEQAYRSGYQDRQMIDIEKILESLHKMKEEDAGSN